MAVNLRVHRSPDVGGTASTINIHSKNIFSYLSKAKNKPVQRNNDTKLLNPFYTYLQMGATCLIDSFVEIYSAVNELKSGRTMVDKVEIMTIGVALAGS
ncbi:MAG: hypothetical protein KDE33_07910 [Bacteroidetes bacterium]|nr:hypothetical protein [Bacteroidota bacterium]